MTKKKKRKLSAGSGTLLTISILFLMSGTIRILDGVAFAKSAEPEASARPDPTPRPPGAPLGTEGLKAAMKAIKVREAKLIEAEQALTDRARALEVAEATVTQKLRELTDAEARLKQTMAQSSEAAEDDLARLTNVFENMKPKEATEIFSRMAPEFAAGFLGRMRADAAALVLSGLDPDAAYSISVLLAGRNANAPVE